MRVFEKVVKGGGLNWHHVVEFHALGDGFMGDGVEEDGVEEVLLAEVGKRGVQRHWLGERWRLRRGECLVWRHRRSAEC